MSAVVARVLFDATPLGLGWNDPRARTGIWRAADGLLAGALARDDLDVGLTAVGGVEEAVLAELACIELGGAWRARWLRAWRGRGAPFALARLVRSRLRSARGGGGRLTRLARGALYRAMAPRRLPAGWDVYHSPYDPLPPPGRVPAATRVLTVHDCSPLVVPDLFEPRTREHFTRVLASVDRARDWVVCVSETTRRDLLAHVPLPAERVVAIPLAADARFAPPGDAAIARMRARYALPRPYLACLSALGPRKNLARLLRAVASAARAGRLPDLDVVIAGPPAAGVEDIRAAAADPALAGRVRWPGYIRDEDVPALLAGAVAFAFPSLHEGFGLPPLEAMACGAPVVAGAAGALPEVLGDAALLVDPRDEAAIAEAIAAVAGDAALRARLRERGLARAQAFSWRSTVQRHAELYAELAARARSVSDGTSPAPAGGR